MCTRFCAMLLGIAVAGNIFAMEPTYSRIAYPPDSGVVVVTENGIANDGKTDVTQALQALVKTKGSYTTFYFPNGVYLVSDMISLGKNTRVTWIGETRDGVVFRLKDSSPGYQDPAAPKKVLQSCQHRAVAFWINWANFTVDVGKGNPGAVAMEFGANNQGSLRDVVLRAPDGSGAIGLDLAGQGMGPLLVENVTIDGFDTGLTVWRGVRTLEHVEILNARKVGLYNKGAGIFARALNIRGNAPAYQGEEDAAGESRVPLLMLLDSKWQGAGTAIDGGEVFLRNVEFAGFQNAQTNTQGTPSPLAVGTVKEWCNRPVASRFGTTESVQLAPADPPVVPWSTDFSQWANVMKFRKEADGDDDAPAVQRAIDSGAEVIYFPNLNEKNDGRKQPQYKLESVIHVKPTVRRIIGCGGLITHNNIGREGNYLWRIEGKSDNPVIMEYMMSLYSLGACMRLHHSAQRPLVIRSSTEIMFESTPDAGDVHARDVTGLGWRLRNKRAWLGQFNLEAGIPKVESYGTKIWCLGFKSEMEGDLIHVNGGQAEVLGAMFFGGPGNTPLFKVVDADLTVAMTFEIIGASLPRGYYTLVEETQNGTTRSLARGDTGVIPRDARASLLPYYVARAGATGGAKVPWVQGGSDPRWRVGETVEWKPVFQAGTKRKWSATGLPQGLSINPKTGVISGTTRKGERCWVEISLTDEHGTASAAHRFNVGCPIFTEIPSQTVRVDEEISIAVEASEITPDKKGRYNIKVSGRPDGVRFDSRKLLLHVKPTTPGTYTMQAIARNKVGGTKYDFVLIVK